MKTCQFCNRQIPEDSNICPYCGRRVNEPVFTESQQSNNYTNPNDVGGCGWTALGFFFPVVGLILYLVWQNEKPISAKAAGKGALISVILSIIPFIVLLIIFVSGNAFDNIYQTTIDAINVLPLPY